VGKFASAASALAQLSTIHITTETQEKDVYILNVLKDAIINAFWPGHIVLIGMTSNEFLCWSPGFCNLFLFLPKAVSLKFWGIYIFFHLSLELFIGELLERGIQQEALFFFCYGLSTAYGKTKNYETNVLAVDLRNAILGNVPRYRIRPAVFGFLYAASVGEFSNSLIELLQKGF
jgi:hypothetical protein